MEYNPQMRLSCSKCLCPGELMITRIIDHLTEQLIQFIYHFKLDANDLITNNEKRDNDRKEYVDYKIHRNVFTTDVLYVLIGLPALSVWVSQMRFVLYSSHLLASVYSNAALPIHPSERGAGEVPPSTAHKMDEWKHGEMPPWGQQGECHHKFHLALKDT